jgi:uncharacterized protein DUF4157
MWPFGRKAEAPAEGPRPIPAPVIRRDWVGLPPIQRLIGEHPLTAPSDRFSDGLTTHQDPSVSSNTMGHHVVAEAPSGIVLALAQPATRSDGPEMVHRPRVQRRAAAATDSGEWEAEEAASDAARPAPPSAERQPAPALFELPVAAAAPSIQRLTRVPEGEPVPFMGKRRAPALESIPASFDETPMSVPDAPAPAQRLTLGQARRLGLGPPINRVPERGVQRAAVEPMAMPLAPSPALGSPARSEAVPAPTTEPASPPPAAEPSVPVTNEVATQAAPSAAPQPAIQMSHQDEPAPAATSDGNDAGRLDLPLVARIPTREAAAAPLTPDGETDHASIPGLPISLPLVQRAAEVTKIAERAESVATMSPTGQATAAPRPTVASRPSLVRDTSSPLRPSPAMSAATLPALLAPLVSARPLRPTVSLQRASEAVPNDIEEPISRAFDTSLAGVRIDRSDAGTAGAESMEARAFTQGDDVVLPPTQGSLGYGPARSLLAHELTHVAQQRRLGAARPAEASAHGRRLELQAQRVERAWASEEDSSSTPTTEPASQTSHLPLAPVVPATIQRAMAAVTAQAEAADAAQGSAPVVTAQREPDVATPPAPAAATAAAAETVSAAAATREPSEQSMDELAGRLYDRIRGRLKNELLVDRERAGFLTDLR